MMYCFMVVLNNGARQFGGVGDILLRRSYYKDKLFFLGRITYDVIYYITIIVVLLKLVFGIIFNNFRELRIQNQENNNDMQNICFICNSHRDDIEKEGNNFEKHRNKEHNVWNYVFYIIGLKLSKIQDLNAISSYAYEKIEKGSVDWFPINEVNSDVN